MRNHIIRALNKMAQWLGTRHEHTLEQRAIGNQQLCPNCIYIRDDRGFITEVIDCRTLNQHNT